MCLLLLLLLLLLCNIPTMYVTVSPRDSSYVTPLVKSLLNKRRRLHKWGRLLLFNVNVVIVITDSLRAAHRLVFKLLQGDFEVFQSAWYSYHHAKFGVAWTSLPAGGEKVQCLFLPTSCTCQYLFGGDFEVLALQGQHFAPMGIKFGVEQLTKGPSQNFTQLIQG